MDQHLKLFTDIARETGEGIDSNGSKDIRWSRLTNDDLLGLYALSLHQNDFTLKDDAGIDLMQETIRRAFPGGGGDFIAAMRELCRREEE